MANTIIGIFSRKDGGDPLADLKSVTTWLARQPTNDDLGMQEAMIRLLEDMGAEQPKVTPSRVGAILELDRQSLLIQSRLIRQYLHPALSDLVRQRLWHASDDLARWLAYTYENMFAAMQEFFISRKAKVLAPAVASRMFYYRGVQAKQGLFRYERWIPGKWKGLHQAYAEAARRDAARIAYSPNPELAADQRYSAEEEYLQILLLQRVNTGNLTPAQVEVVAAWLRGCAHMLALAPAPLEGNGFWLDLGLGDGLLVRKPQSAQGVVLYLDVAPLHAEMEKGQIELSQLSAGAPNPQQRVDASVRLALLRRVDPLLRPKSKPVERRGARMATDRPLMVAVGLAEIAVVLHSSRADTQLAVASERLRTGSPAEASAAAAPADADTSNVIEYPSTEAAQSGWWMHDTSDSGCCLVSEASEAHRQRLGGVLGIREKGDDRWKIGISRRLKKLSGGRIEVGVEVIAQHSLLISPKPIASHNSGYTVDGIDVMLEGKGFDALYLPPGNSAPESPWRSMLVPAVEYAERRRFFLTLGSSAYTVEFDTPIERAKDWVWTRFAVVSRVD
ncbi:MAG: hypothetical protein ABJB04_00320 [Betaproteobacteria bacterium]